MNSNRKDLIYQILFFICIAVTYLNNYEVAFAVWVTTILFTLQLRYSVTFFKYVACFAAILLIAMVSGIFREHGLYKAIRDFTYLVKPIAGFFVGYQLCRLSSKKALDIIVTTGAIIAVIHLMILAIAFIDTPVFTVNKLRSAGGYFSDYEIYVLIILIFHKEFQLNYSKQKLWFLIALLGISSFLYLARTNFIQFVILFIGLKGYYVINARSVRVLSTVIGATLLVYGAIWYSNPIRNGKGLEAFLYKVKIAPIEPFKTRINTENWKDFNDNYRSYENIIAVRQVSREGLDAILFGEGLGATLDLGREVWSNDGEMVRYIPIVHNGYMTVFLKSGILGVLFLLLFIVLLFRQQKSEDKLITQINFLLVGTSIFLIVSNWVFLGLYLKLDNKSILIGYLLCLKQVISNENSKKVSVLET